MDIGELKELLKNSTSVLILENGEPAFVILDYTAYRSAVKSRESEVKITSTVNGGVRQNGAAPYQNGTPMAGTGLRDDQEGELLERLNREILSLKHQIQLEEQKNGTPSF